LPANSLATRSVAGKARSYSYGLLAETMTKALNTSLAQHRVTRFLVSGRRLRGRHGAWSFGFYGIAWNKWTTIVCDRIRHPTGGGVLSCRCRVGTSFVPTRNRSRVGT